MRELTRLFKALSDETRLAMLGLLLREGELCVCDFVELLQITQSKASRHLRRLVDAGLLDDRREGTWVYFRRADEPGLAQARLLGLLPELLDSLPAGLVARLAERRRQKARGVDSCRRLPPDQQGINGGKR